MSLLVGLRAEYVGMDTHAYLKYASQTGVGARFGVLFEAMRALSLLFSSNPQTFLLIVAIFTMIPLGLAINKISTKPCLSLLIYIVATAGYFLETFNIIRQAISIIYMILAVSYWSDGKRTLFFLFTIISVLLHHTSIVVIIVLFLQKEWTPSYMQALTIVGITAILGFTGLFDFLGALLNQLSLLVAKLNYTTFSNYAFYLEEDITSNLNSTGVLMHILPISITCILAYIPRFSDKDIYYKLMLVGCVIVNLLVSTSYVQRIASALTIMQIFVMARSLCLSTGIRKIAIKSFIFCMTMIYLYTIVKMNLMPFEGNPLPYQFFFNVV